MSHDATIAEVMTEIAVDYFPSAAWFESLDGITTEEISDCLSVLG